MQELFTAAADVLSEHQQMNYSAMLIMQSLGFNVFKRKHRCAAKHCFDYKIRLDNAIFYRYSMVLQCKHKNVVYEPKGLKDHLTAWDAKLAQSIATLGKLNKMHMDKTGVTCCIIEEVLCHMTKAYENTGRWCKYLEDVKWEPMAMHMLDMCLHKKYKALEGD